MSPQVKSLSNSVLERPVWIRAKYSWGENYSKVREILASGGLNTICVSGSCPNAGECWANKHVTFMLLGNLCTRKCKFCDVPAGIPGEPDPMEPDRIAQAVCGLNLKYVVITSVTRDDLDDRGAGQFIKVTEKIKELNPGTLVEFLIPDLDADYNLLSDISSSAAVVIGHNIEMPERLYKYMRPGSDYKRSLKTLNILKKISGLSMIKSSIMVGVGETDIEIKETINDLKAAGVDILYVGQYLSPSKKHWGVKKFYTPREFDDIRNMALDAGLKVVRSGPMVRSSYKAYESYLESRNNAARKPITENASLR